MEPGYYRSLVDNGAYYAADDYVYLLGVEGDQAVFVHHDSTFRCPVDAFLCDYRPAPEGEAAYHRIVAGLMSEISALGNEAESERRRQREFSPHLVGGQVAGLIGSPVPDEGGMGESDAARKLAEASSNAHAATGIMALPDAGAMAAKRHLARMRNDVQRRRAAITQKQESLKVILQEQSIILKAKLEGLEEMVSLAQDAIDSINIYLGAGEEFARILDGEPAPADTPITIRQLVLAADEESLCNLDDGGLTARDMEEFDAWLAADPTRIDQLIPEPKGIVAIRARRRPRDYGDPWENRQRAKEDLSTSFLLRNGDRVFRLATTFDAGVTLLPKRDEFEALFWDEETRHVRDEAGGVRFERERVRLTPGSQAWVRAEKKADARRRHYFKVALLLQGLLDRTPVFHPLARPVNVASLDADGDTLRLIFDGDALLGDGRPRFREWLAGVNAGMAVGARIVADFRSSNSLHQYRDDRGGGNSRLSTGNVEFPLSDEIHTLEGRRDGGFYFLYRRRDTNWRWESDGTFLKRASCVIKPDDCWALCVDEADEADLAYYLSNRMDRPEYLSMVPVLRQAMLLKRREAEEERPFRQLLASQIASTHRVELDDAEAPLDALVSWWKHKNRVHRSLLSSDTKALAMIVSEFGYRRKAEAARRDLTDERRIAIVGSLRTLVPQAMLIAHKTGTEYAVLAPAAPQETVYATEQAWRIKEGTESMLVSQTDWAIVDKRYMRWDILFTGPLWEGWRVDAPRGEYLTGPERELLVDEATKRALDACPAAVFVAATVARYQNRDLVSVWYVNPEGRLPAPGPGVEALTRQIPQPRLYRVMATLTRVRGQTKECYQQDDTRMVDRGGTGWPWTPGHKTWDEEQRMTLWVRDDGVAALSDLQGAYHLLVAEHGRLNEIAYKALGALSAQVQASIKERAYQDFLAEFNDPDLWEGHLKTLTLPHARFGQLNDVLRGLTVRYVRIDGLTVRAAIATARLMGIDIPSDIPEDVMDLVLSAPTETTPPNADNDTHGAVSDI